MPGSKCGDEGMWGVRSTNQRHSVWPFWFVAIDMCCRMGCIGKVPTSPRPPLYLRVGLAYEAHSVATAQQLDL